MRALVLTLLAGLAATGCSKSDVRTVDLNTASGVIVLVVLDRTGAPLRALPPFGLEQGRLTFGEAPRLRLEEGEASTVRLQIDPTALRQTLPRLDLTRLNLWQVSVQAPPDSPVYAPTLQPAGVHTTLALPATALEIVDEAGTSVPIQTLSAQLTLQVWLDPQGCAEPGRTGLKPYGITDQPFLEAVQGARYSGILSIAPLGARQVLISGAGVGLLTRNQAFNADAAHWISRADLQRLGFRDARVGDLSLGPQTEQPRQAFAAVQHAEGGALLELAVQPDQISYVRTTTMTDRALFHLDRHDDGQLAVLGDEGLVLLVDTQTGDTRRLNLPASEYAGSTKSHIIWTGSAEEPLIANSETSIHGLDAARTAWSTTGFNSLGFGVRFRGIARWQDEIWLASNGNTLVRRRGPKQYDVLAPRPSPGLRACGSADGSAFPTVLRHIDVIAADERALFIAYDDCSIVMRLRTDDLCASSIEAAAGEVAVVNWTYTTAQMIDGAVIFGTNFGDLWISEVIE